MASRHRAWAVHGASSANQPPPGTLLPTFIGGGNNGPSISISPQLSPSSVGGGGPTAHGFPPVPYRLTNPTQVEVEFITQKCISQQQQIEALQAELLEVKHNHSQDFQLQQMQSLTKEVTALQREVFQHRMNEADNTARFEEAQRELDALRAQLSQSDTGSNKVLTRQLEEATAQLRAKANQVAVLSSELDALKASGFSSNNNNGVRKQLGSERGVQTIPAPIPTSNSIFQSGHHHVTDEENNMLRKEIAMLQLEWSSQVTGLQTDLEDVRRKNLSLQRDLKDASQGWDDAMAELEKEKLLHLDRVRKTDAIVNELNAKLQEAHSALQEIDKERGDGEIEVDVLRKQMDDMATVFRETESLYIRKVGELNERVVSLEKMVHEAKEDQERKRRLIDEMKQSCDERIKKMQDDMATSEAIFQDRIQKKEAVVNELNRTITQLQKRTTADDVVAHNEKLTEQLTLMEKSSNQLLDELRNKIKALEGENEKLSNELKSRQQQPVGGGRALSEDILSGPSRPNSTSPSPRNSSSLVGRISLPGGITVTDQVAKSLEELQAKMKSLELGPQFSLTPSQSLSPRGAEMASYISVIQDLQSRLAEKEDALLSLQQDVASTSRSGSPTALNARLTALQQAHDCVVSELKAKIASLESERTKWSAEASNKVLESLEKVNTSEAHGTRTVIELEQRCQLLQEENNALKQQISGSMSPTKASAFRNDLSTARFRLGELEAENAKLTAKFNSPDYMSPTRARNAAMQLRTWEEKALHWEHDLNRLESENQRLIAKITELDTINQQLNVKRAEASQAYEKGMREAHDRISSLERFQPNSANTMTSTSPDPSASHSSPPRPLGTIVLTQPEWRALNDELRTLRGEVLALQNKVPSPTPETVATRVQTPSDVPFLQNKLHDLTSLGESRRKDIRAMFSSLRTIFGYVLRCSGGHSMEPREGVLSQSQHHACSTCGVTSVDSLVMSCGSARCLDSHTCIPCGFDRYMRMVKGRLEDLETSHRRNLEEHGRSITAQLERDADNSVMRQYNNNTYTHSMSKERPFQSTTSQQQQPGGNIMPHVCAEGTKWHNRCRVLEVELRQAIARIQYLEENA